MWQYLVRLITNKFLKFAIKKIPPKFCELRLGTFGIRELSFGFGLLFACVGPEWSCTIYQ